MIVAMKKKDDDSFAQTRLLAALRAQQAGFNSNHFWVDRIGDENFEAVTIEYIPTHARRMYALDPESMEGWVKFFIDELKAGLFHDPATCAQQFADTQKTLFITQKEYKSMLWASNDSRTLKKWEDFRETTRRHFFTSLEDAQSFGKGYLKAVTILNAGAIIALLTFSHNIFARELKCHQAPSLMSDSVYFLGGIGFALFGMAIGYWSNHYFLRNFRKVKRKAIVNFFFYGGDIAGIMAAVFFFVGAWYAKENIADLLFCLPDSSAIAPAHPSTS